MEGRGREGPSCLSVAPLAKKARSATGKKRVRYVRIGFKNKIRVSYAYVSFDSYSETQVLYTLHSDIQ